jgi:hypothetical protein
MNELGHVGSKWLVTSILAGNYCLETPRLSTERTFFGATGPFDPFSLRFNP